MTDDTFPRVTHPSARPIRQALEETGPVSPIIDSVVTQAMRKLLETEEKIATAAHALGCGYAIVTEYRLDDFSYVQHYLVSALIPPMERYEFPSWSSFELWRGAR
jgi:hypothetical protein